MRTIGLALLMISGLCAAQKQDAETYLKVQKARADVPGCVKLLTDSQAAGSIPLLLMKYSELDKRASELTHCGFVFRIAGDTDRADQAGDESDRYDAAIAQQMEQYLKAKNLWQNFLKQDCRPESSDCGKR